MLRIFMLVASTCAAAFAGCLGNAQPPASSLASAPLAFQGIDPFWLSDPSGDERGFAIDSLGYGPSCRIDCEPLPTEVPEGSGPAPMLDLLRVGVASETADAFVVAMEVARLDEGFLRLDEGGAYHRVAEYHACWGVTSAPGARCAILVASPSKEGPVLLSTFNLFERPECGATWEECAWDIDAKITYGSPGMIQFTVPKVYAAWDGAPLEVQGLRAETRWFGVNKALPLWHFAWTVRAPGDHQHDHVGLVEPAGLADETGTSAEARPLASWSPPARPVPEAPVMDPIMEPGPGNLLAAGGIRDYPQLDLVSLELREEEDMLAVRFGMADLPTMPSYDLQVALLLQLDNGDDWELGVMQADGDAYGYAGRCISFGCHHAFLNRTALQVVDDSYELRVPLTALGSPANGTQTTWLLAYTMYGEANRDIGPAGQDGSVNVHSGSILDHHVGGRPFVFSGQGEPVDSGHHH